MDPRVTDVLEFWFGAPASGAPRAIWFRKDSTFDAAVRTRFGSLLELGLAGGLREWDDRAEGRLARIVVLDQFTRNAFRDTPRAFAGDSLALEAACALVASGRDRQLGGLQRWFAYLPFEHAESLPMQQESLRLFEALAAEQPLRVDALEWARKHHAVIERFGRYPHRNAVLGRPSTPEELEFLAGPGSSF